MRYRPHEAPVEDAAGKLIPLFIFDGLEKTRGDARRGRNLIKRHAAHFSLALQIVAKSPFGHFFPGPMISANIGRRRRGVNLGGAGRQFRHKTGLHQAATAKELSIAPGERS